MRLLPLIALLFLFAAPAAAGELIYREDSGLTKTEFLLASGKYSAALDSANDVLTRRPASADALTYKGYALFQLGQREEAIKVLKQALQVNETHLGANKYLADVYLAEGDTASALDYMRVIRMACQAGDCPELRALRSEIDRINGGSSPKSAKKTPRAEE